FAWRLRHGLDEAGRVGEVAGLDEAVGTAGQVSVGQIRQWHVAGQLESGAAGGGGPTGGGARRGAGQWAAARSGAWGEGGLQQHADRRRGEAGRGAQQAAAGEMGQPMGNWECGDLAHVARMIVYEFTVTKSANSSEPAPIMNAQPAEVSMRLTSAYT